eukprot:2774338-Amphidinium_carterae.1
MALLMDLAHSSSIDARLVKVHGQSSKTLTQDGSFTHLIYNPHCSYKRIHSKGTKTVTVNN